MCAYVPPWITVHLARRVGDLEHLRDRWDARRRCQPVSPRADPARSACATASRSSKAAPGRAGRPGRRLGGGRRAGEGARRPAPRPSQAEGTAVSHHRRVRVPGGHAHPRPGDHLRVIGCPACCPESAARPGTAAQWPASGGRGGCAALTATRAPGHEPHDDEYGHRDQSDDDKRLERSHDPARSRDGKPDGENRAEDCPDDPAHVPSMPPDLCRR